MINWEVILWTCVTVGVLVGVFGIILTAISAVNMKKRRQQMADMHTTLAIGSKVMFAGGIYGKVISANIEQGELTVELAKDVEVKVLLSTVRDVVKDEVKPANNNKKSKK